MAEQPDIQVLRRSFLLHGLSDEELDRFARRLRRRSYRRGEVVCHQGDPGGSLHLVYEGQVKVVVASASGEEAVLRIIGPGELFGELSLLDGLPRSATVVALEGVKTATLDRADFLDLLRRSPTAVEGLLAALAGMIRRLTDDVADLMFLDLRGRLAKKLLELAEVHGRLEREQLEIQVSLTQEELAGMIGATRPRVNKLLGFFEQQGAIARQGRRIVVRNPEALRLWATPQDEL